MKAIMIRASTVITGGLPIQVEVEPVPFPARYMDERGQAMWGSRHGAPRAENRES